MRKANPPSATAPAASIDHAIGAAFVSPPSAFAEPGPEVDDEDDGQLTRKPSPLGHRVGCTVTVLMRLPASVCTSMLVASIPNDADTVLLSAGKKSVGSIAIDELVRGRGATDDDVRGREVADVRGDDAGFVVGTDEVVGGVVGVVDDGVVDDGVVDAVDVSITDVVPLARAASGTGDAVGA